MNCIYCTKPNADSESHIIPEALGKGPILKTGVCTKCNNEINNDIEKYISKKLSYIRNFLQLTGKRSNRPTIDIEATFFNTTLQISARGPRDLDSKILTFQIDEKTGKKKGIVFICPDNVKIEQAKRQYEKRHPNAIWEEISPDIIDKEIQYRIYFDMGVFADPKCLRLAAKIALEWWCSKRSPQDIAYSNYDEIKQYIRYGGKTSYPLVSVVSDKNILSYFIKIPFGIHTLFIGADPRSHNLTVLVGLFSFVFYKVILNRHYSAFTKIEELAIVNPQTGKVYEPMIRASLHDGPYISGINESDNIEPIEVLRAMESHLLNRFNKGLENILTQSQKAHEK